MVHGGERPSTGGAAHLGIGAGLGALRRSPLRRQLDHAPHWRVRPSSTGSARGAPPPGPCGPAIPKSPTTTPDRFAAITRAALARGLIRGKRWLLLRRWAPAGRPPGSPAPPHSPGPSRRPAGRWALLCLRAQAGGGVQGWGRDGLGTGVRGRGARTRRALMSTTRSGGGAGHDLTKPSTLRPFRFLPGGQLEWATRDFQQRFNPRGKTR